MRFKKLKVLKLPNKLGSLDAVGHRDVFVFSDPSHKILALQPPTFEPLWEAPARGFSAAFRLDDKLVTSSDSHVKALDIRTGMVRWIADYGGDWLGSWRDWVVVDATKGTALELVRPTDGRTEARIPLPDRPWSVLGDFALTKADGRVKFSADPFSCVDLESGDVLWNAEFPPPGPPTVHPPSAGTITTSESFDPIPWLLGLHDGLVLVQKRRATRAWHVRSGELAWETILPFSVGLGVATPCCVCLISFEELMGVETATGRILWRRPLQEYGGEVSLAREAYRGLFIVAGYDGSIRLVSPTDGAVVGMAKGTKAPGISPWEGGLILIYSYGRFHILEEVA
jgi:outer membrane protein assembly factor BamB